MKSYTSSKCISGYMLASVFVSHNVSKKFFAEKIGVTGVDGI